jgi:uncharacterized membrane protein YqjE
MADTAATRSRVRGEASLGDLVSLAVQDASRLVRAELDLAKVELREDGKRLGISGLLIGMAAFAGCLVLMLLCFALAYGLNTLGIPLWASFLIVAALCVLLAALAILIVRQKLQRVTGLSKTRQTVQEDLALLRRDSDGPARLTAGTG